MIASARLAPGQRDRLGGDPDRQAEDHECQRDVNLDQPIVPVIGDQMADPVGAVFRFTMTAALGSAGTVVASGSRRPRSSARILAVSQVGQKMMGLPSLARGGRAHARFDREGAAFELESARLRHDASQP